VRNVGVGQVAQAFQVSRGTEGLGDDWTPTGDDVDTKVNGVIRHDDVGEKNGRVDAVPAYGLHRDLAGQSGVGDGVKDGAGAAQGTVFRERATGLSHEPHGDVVHRLASAGSKKYGVAHGAPLDGPSLGAKA